MVAKYKWWILLGLVVVNLGWGALLPNSFKDFWLSQDQQAQLHFEKGEFEQASNLYQDTKWKAYSAYLAGDFASTIILLKDAQDDESQFLMANANAYSGQLEKALEMYTQLVTSERFAKAATHNIQVMKDAIQKIKDAPPEAMEAEKKIDDRQLADEETEAEATEQLQLSDAAWLKQVRQDPSKFLRQKFQQEYASE